jgi:phosphoribosylamine--glycine ligase/phosphoribosylformylglycinamidine cyclo-ligase
MLACVEGQLHNKEIKIDNKSCAVVVMASSGYPGSHEGGKEIKISVDPDLPGTLPSIILYKLPLLRYLTATSVNLFHAGPEMLDNGALVTAGGRVMAVSATADSLEEAVGLAYAGVAGVEFEEKYYRQDIAHR